MSGRADAARVCTTVAIAIGRAVKACHQLAVESGRPLRGRTSKEVEQYAKICRNCFEKLNARLQ